MLDVVIRLKQGVTLKQVAQEVQALNAYAIEGTPFPRPIACNPDSETEYGFLGATNTSPDEQGFVNVRIPNYNYLDLSCLPAVPQSFTFCMGVPDSTTLFA